MSVHAQRGASLWIPGKPSLRERRLPIAHALGIVPQGSDLAAQDLRLRTTVQAEDGAPLSGSLMAQRLRIADPGQHQEGQKQQNAGQPVKAARQPQERPHPVQKPFPQQHRQPGQNAAASDRKHRFLEPWLRLAQKSRRRQLPARRVPRAAAHRRLPVARVPRSPVHRRARASRHRFAPDNPRPAVVAERAHRDPQPPRHRRAAEPRCKKPIRLPNRRSIQHAAPASPTRREKSRLPLRPKTFDRTPNRRAVHAKGCLQLHSANTALGKLRNPKQHRRTVPGVMDIKRLQVGEVNRPTVPNLEGEGRAANLN